jgi:hypothetical protein
MHPLVAIAIVAGILIFAVSIGSIMFDAFRGSIDGEVDATLRKVTPSSDMQNNDPGVKHPIRRAAYVWAYRRGWSKQIREENTARPPRIMPREK